MKPMKYIFASPFVPAAGEKTAGLPAVAGERTKLAIGGREFAVGKDGWTEGGELIAVASTGALDREGEIIEPEAWKDGLEAFRANPVILAAHQHRLSTGSSSTIGHAEAIDVVDGRLLMAIQFADSPETPLGREYRALYQGRHMRAFSVGFMPVEGEWRNVQRGAAGQTQRVWAHTRCELWEVSAVPVPANPEALARMIAAAAGGREDDDRDVTDAIVAAVLEAMKAPLETGLKELEEKLTSHIIDECEAIRAMLPETLDADPPPEAPEDGETAPERPACRRGPVALAAERLARACKD